VLVVIGTFLPASDVARLVILFSFAVSGALIGRWWAPFPSLLASSAIFAAEEANHLGFGPGTRIGTAIEIHSGGDFSVAYLTFTSAIAIALATAGLVARGLAMRALRKPPL
jgi:hypothetical protein